MEELTIDREFEKLCRPLTAEEEGLLEESLLADGCREPIVLWANHDDTILDGMNRYRLCRKNDLKFPKKVIHLPDRQAAMKWIARNQLGRRNLNETQRASLAARLVTATVGGSHSANLQNGNEKVTTAEAAELCNVSTRSVASAKKVHEHGSTALQKAMDSGDVPASVAAKLAELPKAEQSKIVAKGPEAVKEAVKQYKDEFDTAKFKPARQGSVKKQWSDQTFIEACGQFAKQIDAAYGAFLLLIDECHANVGGSDADVNRARRAVHHGKAKSHELLDGVTTAFRTWRPKR